MIDLNTGAPEIEDTGFALETIICAEHSRHTINLHMNHDTIILAYALKIKF